MSILEAIEQAKWEPGIGDDTLLGWVTVGLYAITAIFCTLVILKQRKYEIKTEQKDGRSFWIILLLFIVILGINKQLDVQTLITQTFRNIAYAEGWYKERKEYQKMFIVFIATSGVFCLAIMLLLIRKAFLRRSIALFGLIFLVSFIIIRAASFHHADTFFRTMVGDHYKLYSVLEASGITIIFFGALINLIYYHKQLNKNIFQSFDDNLEAPKPIKNESTHQKKPAEDLSYQNEVTKDNVEIKPTSIPPSEPDSKEGTKQDHSEKPDPKGKNMDFVRNTYKDDSDQSHYDGPGFNVWSE